jgi:hypothetical protein
MVSEPMPAWSARAAASASTRSRLSGARSRLLGSVPDATSVVLLWLLLLECPRGPLTDLHYKATLCRKAPYKIRYREDSAHR